MSQAEGPEPQVGRRVGDAAQAKLYGVDGLMQELVCKVKLREQQNETGAGGWLGWLSGHCWEGTRWPHLLGLVLPAGGEVAEAAALLHVVSPHQVELLLVAVSPNALVPLRQGENKKMGFYIERMNILVGS